MSLSSPPPGLPLAPHAGLPDGDVVSRWDVLRLDVPIGRAIGDHSCSYERFALVVVRLDTRAGRTGWGFFEVPSGGVFTTGAWYLQVLPSEAELASIARRTYADGVVGATPDRALAFARERRSTLLPLDNAFRLALWDLVAQVRDRPLHRVLDGPCAESRDRIPIYGSLLDHPLADEEAAGLARRALALGVDLIKVKVGGPSLDRDVTRLAAVRNVLPDEVALSADANEGWSPADTYAALQEIDDAGVTLAYIEDPVPHQDVAGLAALVRDLDVPVAGHDYASTAEEIRTLVEADALSRLRVFPDIDLGLLGARLATEHGLPATMQCWAFDLGVHIAAITPAVDRLEIAMVGWEHLTTTGPVVRDGTIGVPTRPGHGIEPDPAALAEWRLPESAEACG
jgi:L-alanine-DL-glutamate epimerase-like enolase superfamily enzyme